jgi:cyclophilin family peptidyl-prolyl cis-trans isomerase
MKSLILLGSVIMVLAIWNSFASGADDSCPPLKLTISTPKTKCTLGDFVEVNFKMENVSRERLKVIKPIIDVYSVSLKMEYSSDTSTNTLEAPFSFTYTAYTPSIYAVKLTKEQLEKTAIDPGKSITTVFKIPAIKVGKLAITAIEDGICCGIKPSNTIEVDVSLSEKDKNKELVAVIDTNQGKIITSFYVDDAPNHVLNFVKLAKQGFYDKLIFHRVMKGFMIQGGCPKKDGSGSPGYSIKAEFNQQKHLEGTLAMARSNHNDSAGSQFYICLAPQSGLDDQYTVFGQTVQGMDVVKSIGETPTSGPRGNPPNRPKADMIINKITIELMELKKE